MLHEDLDSFRIGDDRGTRRSLFESAAQAVMGHQKLGYCSLLRVSIGVATLKDYSFERLTFLMMNRITAWITLSVAGLLAPGIAFAGDDSYCKSTLALSPSEGATGVPLNVMVTDAVLRDFNSGESAESLFERDDVYNRAFRTELEDASGVVIQLEPRQLAGDDFNCTVAFFPVEELQPETTYTVYIRDVRGSTFTTGTTRDTVPPTLSLTQDDPATSGYEGIVSVSEDAIALAYKAPIRFGTHTEAQVPMDGQVVRFSSNYFAGRQVEVRAYDEAGNMATALASIAGDAESDDEDVHDDDIDDEDASMAAGCSVTGPSQDFAPSELALFLLGGVALRRRRHGLSLRARNR